MNDFEIVRLSIIQDGTKSFMQDYILKKVVHLHHIPSTMGQPSHRIGAL